MFMSDVPMPSTDTPAIYLAAKSAKTQKNAASAEHKLGVCYPINSVVDIGPTSNATDYFATYLKKRVDFLQNADFSSRTDVSVRILTKPKHGKLVLTHPEATDYSKYDYQYIPDEGFGSFDHFAFEVRAGGNTVKIYYTMSVGLPGEPTYAFGDKGERVPDLERCAKDVWKISSLPTDPISLASLQRSNDLASILASASSALTNFTNLPGTAVSETTGTGTAATITLDTNAAGHGWFIDTTPGDNSEYLATSDANVWT